MPQGDHRGAIIQNPSIISILLSLLRILPGVTAEYRYDGAAQNLPPSTSGHSRDASVPYMIIERQLPSNLITLPLPLPTPIPLATNPIPLPNGSPVPLLISPYVPPSPSSSVSPSRSSSSSTLVASKTSSSSSAQFSPTGNSNATTNNANGSNRLTAINFLPFIILTSFFIILLMGWCLHGWCTRRPKEKFVPVGRKESRQRRRGWFWNRKTRWGGEPDGLVGGPAYVSSVGQDVEELATVRQSGRFRWPALPEANQGYHPHTPQNDENPFQFAGIPRQSVRPVPSAAGHPHEPNARKGLLSPTTTAGPMSPTSIALRDLYEVVLRNGHDAGGAEERSTLLGVGSGVLDANRRTSGRKRKGHTHQGSESYYEATQLLDLGGRWRVVDDEGGQKLEVRNPSVGEGRLGLTEQAVGLVSDGILDEEDYTPLPTPTRIHPPSRRGWKATGKAMQDSQNLPFSISKDVLPAHPKQIMSPPLENQFYFTPLPSTTVPPSDMRTEGPVVGLASPPARVRVSVRPKSTISDSRERNGHGVQNPSGVVDDRLAATAAGEVTKELGRDTSSRPNGASKGKGKLVKASPAARKRQARED